MTEKERIAGNRVTFAAAEAAAVGSVSASLIIAALVAAGSGDAADALAYLALACPFTGWSLGALSRMSRRQVTRDARALADEKSRKKLRRLEVDVHSHWRSLRDAADALREADETKRLTTDLSSMADGFPEQARAA